MSTPSPPSVSNAAPVPTDLASALALLQRFELMADSMPVLMAYYEYEGLRCAYANRAYAATFGHTPGSIIGRGLAEVIGAEALRQIEPHIERMFAQRQTVSYTRTVVDGGNQAHQFEVSLVPDLREHGDAIADPQGAFVLINNITRFHDAQQALRDGEERLRKFMDASVEGIAFHREGVVSDVNAPILQMLGYRREDMLGRPVMDFVAPEHRPRAEQGRAHPSEQPYESTLLDHRGQRVPVAWGGQQLSVTPTIGVALYPDDGHSADALLRHADAAMYAGKAAGRAVVAMFEPAMAAAIENGQRLDARVAEGLALGEFHLMLQPRLALASAAAPQGLRGRLGGLQAVLRWRHPERGWLAPADFTGGGRRRMLQTLLEWALQEALRLAVRWQALGVVVPLSLNLNGVAPQAEGLAAAVGRALAQQPMADPPLSLELPEVLLAGDRALVRRTFEQLAQLGTPLWLDDFGQGGAALADLRHLPLAGLLVGPSLVAALPQDAATAAVLRGITVLADGLGLPVCAAGVATGAQAEALHHAGCRLLQGGWYEPPMTAAEASAWLATGPR